MNEKNESEEIEPKRHMPNIESLFKIKVEQHGEQYRADPTVLPGMPIVGIGGTPDAAKYDLCMNWLYNIARWYHTPTYLRGNHYNYVPFLLENLNDDMEKLGQIIQ